MALTLRTRRRLLRFTSLLLLVGAVSIGWLAQQPTGLPTTGALSMEAVTTGQEKKLAPRREWVDAKSAIWQMPLRRPLYDPPPPPPKKIVKKELPPLRAKLLGTILEPGASRAMISLPGGVVEFRGIGQPLGPQDSDAVIEAIGETSIQVRRGEELTELTVEQGY